MAQAAMAQMPTLAKPATLDANTEKKPSTGEPPLAATRTDEATLLSLPESVLFVACLMLVSCGERAEIQGVCLEFWGRVRRCHLSAFGQK